MVQKKKELKDKREQARRELLDEIENEEGKINKFGASRITSYNVCYTKLLRLRLKLI